MSLAQIFQNQLWEKSFMKALSFFEQTGGKYTQVGVVLIPNLVIGEAERRSVGKYGRMRKRYLKEHHPILYSE